MGHLQTTMRQIESEEAGTVRQEVNPVAVDLPEIGEPIRYHLRANDFRAGRNMFPAMVLAVNPDRGTVDLLAILDAEEFISQRDVKPHGEDRSAIGWSRVPLRIVYENRQQIEIKQIAEDLYGGYVRPPGSVMASLIDLDTRLKALEKKKHK